MKKNTGFDAFDAMLDKKIKNIDRTRNLSIFLVLSGCFIKLGLVAFIIWVIVMTMRFFGIV